MKKEKSSPWTRAKYLYMLPLAAVAVTAFARPETAAPSSRISGAEITDWAAMAKVKEVEKEQMTVPDTVRPAGEEHPVYDIVEQMPEFPGGTGELQKYLATSVKYPTKALESGLTGRGLVRFVIEQDGTVTNPQVVRSIALSLDAE